MAERSADGAAPASKLWGVLAEFSDPAAIYGACARVHEAGFTRWDAHTPFPVHGLDKAMGLPPSKLPWLVFVAGMLGASGGMTLQWWTSAVDYPLVIAAKPYFSWPAFIPVTFELGVLFAALGSFLGMLHFTRLPTLYHPLFRSERFAGVSDDRFFVSIEAADPKFEPEETQALLRDAGATHVELLED